MSREYATYVADMLEVIGEAAKRVPDSIRALALVPSLRAALHDLFARVTKSP